MRFAAVALFTWILASPGALAQTDFAEPVNVEPIPINYDLKTNTWTFANGGVGQKSGPVVIVDNTTTNGYFTSGNLAGNYGLDNGTLAAGGHNCVTEFAIGYATNSATPIDLRIRFFSSSVSCAASPGTLEASYLLSGLPASDGTTILAYTVTVDLTPGFCFNLPDGNIGWGYERFNTGSTGPLLVGPPNAPGVLNQYGRYTTSDTLVGCYWFGGTPMASFYMKLTGHQSGTSFGAGCAGNGGFVPTLALSGCACEGNSICLDIADGEGGALAALLVSGATGSVPLLNGCVIDLDLSAYSLIMLGALSGAGAGGGTAQLCGTIPSGTAGTSAYVQAVIKDSTAGSITSNGVQIDVAP